MGPPPQWIQHWRHLVASFFNAEYFLGRVLVQAVRLGLRAKIWLEYPDPMWMTEKNILLKKAISACQRDQIQRSGNKDGKYSKCLTCGKQWKGDPEATSGSSPCEGSGNGRLHCLHRPLPRLPTSWTPDHSSSQDGLTDNLGTQAVYLTRKKSPKRQTREPDPRLLPRGTTADKTRRRRCRTTGIGAGYPSSKCKPSTHTP